MPYKRQSKNGEVLKVRKAGEPIAALAFRSIGLFAHKFADTRRCPVCGFIIPKSDEQPDFIVSGDWFYLEVKETDSDGYLKLPKLVTPIQRKRMSIHEGWFFFVMRNTPDGSAPKDVSAFLIPYNHWIQFEEYFESIGVKSIRKEATKRLPGADEILKDYRLSWSPGHAGTVGKWVIPSEFRTEANGQ